MSIGETLTEARSRADLTIADVAARTRIRQTLIRAIEHDDFAVCGGDFYARGHIRAIAAVVKADAGELIREYDADHPQAEPVTLEELPRRSSTRRGGRGRLAGFAVATLVVLAVIAFASYKVAAGTTSVSPSPPPAHRAVAKIAPSTGAPTPNTPTPNPTASSAPAASVSDVTPVSAAAFGPDGTADGDNPGQASLALSDNTSAPWHTNWYATALFGNVQDGTGLLLDLGRTVTVTGAQIQMGSIPGANFQLRAGTTTSDLKTVTSDDNAGGLIRLRLASPVSAQYLLIWFTLLPPDDAGTYQADISGVTATVNP